MLKIYWKSDFPEEEKKKFFRQKILSVKRKGMEELLKWMEDNGIYTQQASTKWHGAYKGGLLDHKLNLYELFTYMCLVFKIDFPEESRIICAFGHDLCKINAYIDGRWNGAESGKGHAKYSIELIEKFITLTPKEKEIIKYHMGMYGTTEFGKYGEFSINELGTSFNNKIAKLFYFCDDMVTQFVDK